MMNGRSRIRVTVQRDGSGVVVALEDDGPGVAVEERERIFKPACAAAPRAPTRTWRAQGSAGLALSRRLARAAGGDVSLCTPKRGARFVVRLLTA